MGLFDYIKCEYPHEGIDPETLYQTKDELNGYLSLVTHVITTDGRLLIDCGHDEDVPLEERPYPDAKKHPLLSLVGCMRHVPKMVESSDFTGAVRFDEWVAVFIDGQLEAIRKGRRLPNDG